jgi:hypothetical protein
MIRIYAAASCETRDGMRSNDIHFTLALKQFYVGGRHRMHTHPRSPTLNSCDDAWKLRRPKATYRLFLLLLMFAVIFGPKSAKWGDVLSIACIAVTGLSLVTPLKGRLPDAMTRQFALSASCGVVLFLYCAVHYLLSSHPDPHQCMRFGQIFWEFSH